MKAKPKHVPSKEKWDAARERYTWHLRPPFKEEFDSSHWWESGTETLDMAELYELARRLPQVGQLRFQFRHASWYGQELRPELVGAAEEKFLSDQFDDLGQESVAIHCLCLIGLKTWPNLSVGEKDFWDESAGNLMGVETRLDQVRCYSITKDAISGIFLRWARSAKPGQSAFQFRVEAGTRNPKVAPVNPKAHRNAISLAAKHFHENPPSSAEIEAAIAQAAIVAHRKGCILLAVAPDLKADDAKALLAQRYREHASLNRRPKPRARRESWLPIISEFEDAERQIQKAKSQVFKRYRSLLDSIHFTTAKPHW